MEDRNCALKRLFHIHRVSRTPHSFLKGSSVLLQRSLSLIRLVWTLEVHTGISGTIACSFFGFLNVISHFHAVERGMEHGGLTGAATQRLLGIFTQNWEIVSGSKISHSAV